MEIEKPKSAAQVRKILNVVTLCVPNLAVILSEIRLDIIVPREIIIEIIPIEEMDTPSETCRVGHAAPSSESGRPRLINARYIIAKRRRYIFSFLVFLYIISQAKEKYNTLSSY